MSDTTPIVQPSSPPSYTEARQSSTTLNNPRVLPSDPMDAPPPYTPPTPSYPYSQTRENSRPGYQRFDNATVCQLVETTCLVQLGPDPCHLQCPSCGEMVITDTDHKAGTLTFISAALCFLFCIVCTFLPFCMDDLQDVEHQCPRCKHYIGTYTRI